VLTFVGLLNIYRNTTAFSNLLVLACRMHETKYNKSRFTLAKLKKRSLDSDKPWIS